MFDFLWFCCSWLFSLRFPSTLCSKKCNPYSIRASHCKEKEKKTGPQFWPLVSVVTGRAGAAAGKDADARSDLLSIPWKIAIGVVAAALSITRTIIGRRFPLPREQIFCIAGGELQRAACRQTEDGAAQWAGAGVCTSPRSRQVVRDY